MRTDVAYRRLDGSAPSSPWPFVPADLSICEVTGDGARAMLAPPVEEDGILVRLQLPGGPVAQFDQAPAGAMVLIDLAGRSGLPIEAPARAVLLLISRSTFRQAGALACGPWPGIRADAVLDPVAYVLVTRILPELAGIGMPDRPLVRHLLLALVAHLAAAYGGAGGRPAAMRGGLAGWQVRRAQEMLGTDLIGRIALSDVARHCGLSVGHFSRSFRQSVGKTPHHWLMGRRLEAAKDMLRDGALPLAEIALSCGFADQSHFTRIFSREIGVSPGCWRRSFAPPPMGVAA